MQSRGGVGEKAQVLRKASGGKMTSHKPRLFLSLFVLVLKTQHLCSFVLLITRGSQE